MTKDQQKALAAENAELKAKMADYEAKLIAESQTKTKAELPADVAKDFQLVGWVGSPCQKFGRFGIIDLTKLTTAKAQALVNRGFKKIAKKEA